MEETSKKYNYLSLKGQYATLLEDKLAGALDPLLQIKAHERVAEKNGVDLLEDEVVAVEKDSLGYKLSTRSGKIYKAKKLFLLQVVMILEYLKILKSLLRLSVLDVRLL